MMLLQTLEMHVKMCHLSILGYWPFSNHDGNCASIVKNSEQK